MSINGLSPGLATGQGAVHEALVVEEVLEAGAEAGLVVVPFEAVLLGLTHSDWRDINKGKGRLSVIRPEPSSANTREQSGVEWWD